MEIDIDIDRTMDTTRSSHGSAVVPRFKTPISEFYCTFNHQTKTLSVV